MTTGPDGYLARLADRTLASLLTSLPAVMITGPRAAGKTTTARRLARTVVRLDSPAEAAAFEADPDAALRSMPEPVLLDEWQAVPGVLGAVKRAVDDERRPGRFILTGSVRADLDSQTWPGTGRVVRLEMYGLTQREVVGNIQGAGLIELLAAGDPDALRLPADVPDLPGYLGMALTGGFPDAVLTRDSLARQAWLGSYLDQVLTRDALAIEDRDPERLSRFFEALALNSAGLATDRSLYSAAGIDAKTARAYERLLVNLRILELSPAWLSNRMSRLVKAPKRYLVDPALIGASLGADTSAALRDGHLTGRLIETFVAAQIRPEAALAPRALRLHHLRESDGRREVDMIAELRADRIVGIEVKATASPGANDARHLMWLRDKLGDSFVGGAVLHTGPRAFVLGPKVLALPIAALWG